MLQLLDGGGMPAGLRELCAVHGSLYFTSYEGFVDVGRARAYEGWEGAEPEPGRFVEFGGFQDGTFMVDRQLSTSETTYVAEHDANDGLRSTQRPFWAWFDDWQATYITD